MGSNGGFQWAASGSLILVNEETVYTIRLDTHSFLDTLRLSSETSKAFDFCQTQEKKVG